MTGNKGSGSLVMQVVPCADDFKSALRKLLSRAEASGRDHVSINASEVDSEVDGYPDPDHRLPLCCGAMIEDMWSDDEVLIAPRSVYDDSLTIRYRLPRR